MWEIVRRSAHNTVVPRIDFHKRSLRNISCLVAPAAAVCSLRNIRSLAQTISAVNKTQRDEMMVGTGRHQTLSRSSVPYGTLRQSIRYCSRVGSARSVSGRSVPQGTHFILWKAPSVSGHISHNFNKMSCRFGCTEISHCIRDSIRRILRSAQGFS
jgi:hypothetical protein